MLLVQGSRNMPGSNQYRNFIIPTGRTMRAWRRTLAEPDSERYTTFANSTFTDELDRPKRGQVCNTIAMDPDNMRLRKRIVDRYTRCTTQLADSILVHKTPYLYSTLLREHCH